MDKTQTGDAGNLLNTVVQALIAKSDPTTVQTLLADTALSSAINGVISKSHELLEGEGIKQVEDLWDGSPNDRAPMKRVRPGGSTADGIPTGPAESMRGGNAERMGSAYSDYAAQNGQQQAYEALGRSLGAVRKSVGLLIDVMQVGKAQQDATSAALTALNTQVSEIGKSLAALTEQVAKAQPVAAKAEDEKKEDGDKDEKKENPFAKSMLASIEKSVSAASAAVVKGLEAKVAGDVAKAKEAEDEAKEEMAKARTLVEAAKAVDASVVGADLLATIAKAQDQLAVLSAPAAKSEAEADAKKNTAAGEAAKSEQVNLPELVTRIEKALSGVGMLQTNMQGLMTAIGNGSRNPNGLPPAFELAKSATADRLVEIRKSIATMYEAGELSDDERDAAADLVARVGAVAKGQMPEAAVLPTLNRAPPAIRQLFQQAA